MARFSYTAQKQGGEVYTGVAEARDRFDLYGVVRREGGTIISVTEDNATNIWNIRYWNAKITSVPEHEKITLARNLGAMLKAGLPLSRALSVTERETRNPRLGAAVAQISSDVRRGEALHASFAKFSSLFPKLFIAMVRAGEEAGDLPGALSLISEQMERSYTLKKKVKGALIYPVIILVAIVGIGALMMVKVVPTLAQTFSEMNAELPSSTKLIIAISDALMNNTIAVVSVISLVTLIGIVAARTPVGRRGLDAFFLHIPIIGGMVREVNAARTARTLSSLLAAGVDMITTISITREVVQNSYFKDVLQRASAGVERGEPLSASFSRAAKLYPPLVAEMMSVGEETGQLGPMLTRLALFYEDEVDRKTKDMSTIIEPFLMVFIGGAVGFFAVAMISPIYQLSQNI